MEPRTSVSVSGLIGWRAWDGSLVVECQHHEMRRTRNGRHRAIGPRRALAAGRIARNPGRRLLTLENTRFPAVERLPPSIGPADSRLPDLLIHFGIRAPEFLACVQIDGVADAPGPYAVEHAVENQGVPSGGPEDCLARLYLV